MCQFLPIGCIVGFSEVLFTQIYFDPAVDGARAWPKGGFPSPPTPACDRVPAESPGGEGPPPRSGPPRPGPVANRDPGMPDQEPGATVRAMGPPHYTYAPLSLDRRTLDEIAAWAGLPAADAKPGATARKPRRARPPVSGT